MKAYARRAEGKALRAIVEVVGAKGVKISFKGVASEGAERVISSASPSWAVRISGRAAACPA